MATPRKSKTNYLEIYERIRGLIARGELVAGARLPSMRTLAAELKIARGTVDTAYARLAGEGLLVSRGRAGTFVASLLPSAARGSAADSATPRDHDPDDFSHFFKMPYPLLPGIPSFDRFPRKLWSQIVARKVRKSGFEQLTYPDPMGLPALRQSLVAHLSLARGIQSTSEQIVITDGYLGALVLVCLAMLEPGSSVWIETPGYGFTKRAIGASGGVPIPISVDGDGLDVDEGLRLAPDARLCIVAPSNQFPLGVSLSLERRRALLEWANRCGGWIVEDDYTGEFRYDGWPLPALKSLDMADRVFYIGTFSKTMFPGLRLGYMIAPASQFGKIKRILRRLDGGRSILEQAALAEFVAQGHFARHIKRMRSLYANRRIRLTSALAASFGARLKIEPTIGGLNLVALTADGRDDGPMEDAAAAAGLRPLALSRLSQGKPNAKGLVLGFANLAVEQADETVRKLADAIRGPLGPT